MFTSGYWFLYCLRRLTHVVSKVEKLHTNICSQRRQFYCFFHVHFMHCLFGFALFYYLSLSSCFLLVHFSLIIWVSDFFCFYKPFFATIHLYHVHFLRCWFALSCCGCCLFLLYLIISFIIIWVSNFFVSLNNFLQQFTCFLKRDNNL
jgi:hypothetical protein